VVEKGAKKVKASGMFNIIRSIKLISFTPTPALSHQGEGGKRKGLL
jgi:hypothetical protein